MPRYIEPYHSHILQSPEVASYTPKMLVWVLKRVGGTKSKRIMRYAGTVDRPLYSKVLVRYLDHVGTLHVERLAPSRLEKRETE